MQPPKNLNKANKPVDLIKFFTFTSVKTTYLVFSIYQSKNFRNSRLVLGDLTPLSKLQNRHDVIYQTFQRLLASVKTQKNPVIIITGEKLVICHLLYVMYTAQRISNFMYSTHYVTWLDNFEMLCNFTRKQEIWAWAIWWNKCFN